MPTKQPKQRAGSPSRASGLGAPRPDFQHWIKGRINEARLDAQARAYAIDQIGYHEHMCGTGEDEANMADAYKAGFQAAIARTTPQNQVIHGQTCEKVPHGDKTGFLHGENDDTPYDVDGQKYCGRCHHAL